jgi:hypothetical protein
MQRAGAVDLDERAEGWRAQGWTGGTTGEPRATGTPSPVPDPALAPEPGTPADPTASPPEQSHRHEHRRARGDGFVRLQRSDPKVSL